MDLDTFFVSCERLADSRLEGKPVLIGGSGDRGVVASCSYEARKFGIHPMMPMNMARQRCPEAIVVRGDSSTYMKHSQKVIEIIREAVPVYEVASMDEFYVDMTGMDKFFGCMQYSAELRQRIMRETGLPISFGLSENKTVSKIATGVAKPNNHRLIEYGTEKGFLAPLSVQKIPMVGVETYKLLVEMGVRRIGTLQDMSVQYMEDALGKDGVTIWHKANAIDASPVIPYIERKSISTERTFEKDTSDYPAMSRIMTAIAEELAYQLRRGNKVAGCVSVKIRYADSQTKSRQRTMDYSAADHDIIPLVQQLFKELYDRRVMVRTIGVNLGKIENGHHQLSLFGESDKLPALYQAMDRIRCKYGSRAIMRAVGMDARSIGRTNPFNGLPPALLPNRRV